MAVIDAPRVLSAAVRQRPDVLVLDSIAAAFCGPYLALRLALRRPRVPIVGMLHQPPGGIDYGPPRLPVQAALDRLTYRYVPRLLLASDSLRDDMLQLGYPPERLAVVPPGRDVAPVVGPTPDEPRHGRRAAFVCVGNWVERKGIVSLLEAFAGLEPDAATLHLIGDPSIEPAYAARVRQRLSARDLAQRVIVHGALPIGEVAAWYAAADAFVLPSLKEPFGTVYGEAMAFGLPVVGWRAGNLPYLADDEREGLLVQPGDLRGLTAAMARLASDADLRRRLGTAARARASQRPTWNEVAKLFFDHLREVQS
ncbi:MAG: glycosyltransferase family 4 protein [Chloroflexi bacterium]|nr:glycosyltransferase family 4 protein [Chloroflexota bacterium]